MRRFFSLFAALLIYSSVWAQYDRVVLKVIDGDQVDNQVRTLMEDNASNLLSFFNSTIITGRSRPLISQTMKKGVLTSHGLDAVDKLWDLTGVVCCSPGIYSTCRSFNDSGYQLRGIPVVLYSADKEVSECFMSMVMSGNGLIDGFMMQLSEEDERVLVGNGPDSEMRLKILAFLEKYLTSVFFKDFDFAGKLFENSTLRYDGKSLKSFPPSDASLGISFAIKQWMSKDAAALKSALRRGGCVSTRLYDISIERHPISDSMYGVNFRQHLHAGNGVFDWKVFMLFDFTGGAVPSIPVHVLCRESETTQDFYSIKDF